MNEDLDTVDPVETVTPTETDDTPLKEDVKLAEDKTKAPPVEDAEPPAKKGDKKTAELSYQNRKLNRQLKSQQDNFNTQMEEMRDLIKSNSPQAKMPDIANFEKLEDFLTARDDYRDAQVPDNSKAERKQASQHEDFNLASRDLIENGNAKYDDFEQVVTDPRSPISVDMSQALFLMEPDIQSEVAYFLGKNPKETLRIANLSPQRQYAELGRIEAKFASKTAPKRASNAPAPIKPVGGKSTSNDVIKDTMDYDAFMKVRNKQLGRS